MQEVVETQEVVNTDIVLQRMRAAAAAFYASALQTGCHPFVEFAGLMNEYINVCERAHQAGIDFTQCNRHMGRELPMQSFEVDYINEKLECIFTGRSVIAVGEQ